MADGGARKPFLAPPSPLAVYVTTITSLGAAGIAIVIFAGPWSVSFTRILIGPTVFLVLAALVGEVKPLRLLQGDTPAGTLSASAPFILALVAGAGVGVAVLAQGVASLMDDIFHRREARKSVFNIAQYTLSVLGARAVYCWLTHTPFLGGPASVHVRDLGPLLVAGMAMITINLTLVAGVVALATGQSVLSLLRDDARHYAVTNLVLICIGCIAAYVAADGVSVLALLAAPVVAAYLMTASATRHAHLASHDSLTGLGNRDRLLRVLDRAFAAAQKTTSQGPGLVLLDLDHFKDINDTLGHPFGDKLLRHVADRFVSALPDDTLVHRLGGDEFAVVVPGGLGDCQQVARELLTALDAPIRIENLELLVRASAGVAVAPWHGADAEALMKRVDIALYHAKLERDRISTYAPEFDINTLERLQLLADLRVALDTSELYVDYQPQVDLSDSRTVGVEALVRWTHPVHGSVRPDDFIPLAESSGLISPLTAFVLDTALGDLARWRTSGHDIRMAVNLSARHLSDLALPRQIAEALAKHHIPAAALVLEVTETGILSDPTRADSVIGALRELGVGIAVDDYGTGNASLSYLKRLRIDELKVDRSFVSDMATDRHDLIIVRSTIALALALGLRVVAEGIEDEPTTAALRELGHVIGQGYHLGRPTTPDQTLRRLDAERHSGAAPSIASL
ncbi:bifunctional diguanylate cyclase/phosphodiesterase [Cellulomonas sp. P24]|uniref:putative bifunctional diguanylate cyclase/phosphodiesterase n=1 Tax=Cellulomonas sp. P24 TaxID=2885206 RepID=UPI00216B3B0A|nr:EAL domain-containing protein [Cellulomonas sp. P24]MCR6493582.1 EAL domain-containing protein [Cellulomonas sp. P24]